MSSRSLSVLSPECWPFEIKWLPQPAFLVGGAVRDALLGRVSEYLDLDFIVMAGAVKVARQIAARHQAGFVLLDAERQIARVVFDGATADFAQAEGGSLETDLGRRDFRINAIAYNPFTGEILDPLAGEVDLKAGLIQMISPANLADDPLRLLRAYRQSAQLGFTIAPETLATIRALAPRLHQIAVERVRTELGYLLNHGWGVPWICQAWQDGLLSPWFPTANQRFEPFSQLEQVAAELTALWPGLNVLLSQAIKPTIKTSLFALAKLTVLVNPALTIAESELMQLKYSQVEMKAVLAILRHLPNFKDCSVKTLFFLFKDLATVFPAFAVVAGVMGWPGDQIQALIHRYLDPNDPIAHPIPLVTGNDLMHHFNLPRSPKIGQLLLEIQLARAEEKIFTRQEALEFATQLLGNAE